MVAKPVVRVLIRRDKGGQSTPRPSRSLPYPPGVGAMLSPRRSFSAARDWDDQVRTMPVPVRFLRLRTPIVPSQEAFAWVSSMLRRCYRMNTGFDSPTVPSLG